jgi:hypothetical protein
MARANPAVRSMDSHLTMGTRLHPSSRSTGSPSWQFSIDDFPNLVAKFDDLSELFS